MLIKRNKSLYITLLSILLFIPIFTFAQETAFIPLTEIPGVTDTGSFNTFLNGAFKLGLAIAVTLAVVMITIGGFQYMASESIFAKGAGRERIQNALIGLLIALLIWLILFTINPRLLEFDINVKKPILQEQNEPNLVNNNEPTFGSERAKINNNPVKLEKLLEQQKAIDPTIRVPVWYYKNLGQQGDGTGPYNTQSDCAKAANDAKENDAMCYSVKF